MASYGVSVPSGLIRADWPVTDSFTDEELAAIKLHPGRGVKLLPELGGFAPVIHELVHSAWTHGDALALPHKDTGTAFDQRCIAALERVLAREAPRVLPVASPVPSVRPSAAAAS